MSYLSRPPEQVGFSRNGQSGLPPGYGQYGVAPPAVPHPGAQMRPQRVYKMTLPSDPEEASMVSLRFIHDLVRDGREDPIVRRKAYQIVTAARVRERDYLGTIRAIHHWIQRNIRYEHDPAGVEFLTQARVLIDQVERGEAFEDCDSFVLLEHALLNSLGIPTRSVIIAADARAPSQWSHIFLEAFNNKRKQWITLDPIMKNKPVGWHPPKFFKKRVVPVADGAPTFPPRSDANGQVGHLPTGMTVHHLPAGPESVPARDMYAGSAGIGWHGFAGYGEGAPTPTPTPTPTATPPPAGARNRIVWHLTQAGVQPQGMDPAAWAAHIESIERSNVNQAQVLAARQAPGGESLFYDTVLLRGAAAWLATHGHSAIAQQLDAYRAELEATWAGKQAAAVAAQPQQVLDRLASEMNELQAIRTEALSYVLPIMDSLLPLLPLAEHHMGRIARRQEFLGTVQQVAEWTSRALQVVGPLTGGITDLLAIAVELGNMGYQMQQAGNLASGSAATVLGNIGAAFEQGDVLVRACQEVADLANRRMQARQQILNEVAAHAPDLVIRAESAAATPRLTPVTIAVVGAAASLAILAVLL